MRATKAWKWKASVCEKGQKDLRQGVRVVGEEGKKHDFIKDELAAKRIKKLGWHWDTTGPVRNHWKRKRERLPDDQLCQVSV